ncbi:hypothetical protein ACTWPT_50650 [Nonomuraea sp. 3N208]|uniref:hypothetical protein n=1 Tax=Nonomuraea sp. 3N208 TaxID=3457421 RepID=UPI003FCFD834
MLPSGPFLRPIERVIGADRLEATGLLVAVLLVLTAEWPAVAAGRLCVPARA